jgi:general stress protein 26
MSATDKEKIVAIMKANASFAFLATSDGEQPRVRPVSPIVEDDLSVWVTTFCSSRKAKQIKENPRVCLSFVEHPQGNKAVTVIGKCEMVLDMKEKKRIWELADFDLKQYFAEGVESKEYCLLKVSVDKIEWWESWETGTQVYEPAKT